MQRYTYSRNYANKNREKFGLGQKESVYTSRKRGKVIARTQKAPNTIVSGLYVVLLLRSLYDFSSLGFAKFIRINQ